MIRPTPAPDGAGGGEERPRTVVEVLQAGAEWLAQRGVDAPRRSMEYLLAHVLGVDRLRVYLSHDRPLDEDERRTLRELVARRSTHEPIAYLLGSQPFLDFELRVGPGVLVPRPETEELVEAVLAALEDRRDRALRIVDLGTGSGCIAVALARALPRAVVDAVDASGDALRYARHNVEALGLAERVRCLQGAWWDACPTEARYDVVVSNPPYVDPAGPDPVDPGVERHEPALALYSDRGQPDSAYRAVAAQLGQRLVGGGLVAMETGGNAAEAGLRVLRDLAVGRDGLLTGVELRNDLAGRPRFLFAVRRTTDEGGGVEDAGETGRATPG